MREEVIAKILEEKIIAIVRGVGAEECMNCLLYTSPSPRDVP